jgi:hypothetical protein
VCRPYSAGILHSVSDHMQNLPNYFTTPNKMTSENDIKGLVSLKFLRPWSAVCLFVTYSTVNTLPVDVSASMFRAQKER